MIWPKPSRTCHVALQLSLGLAILCWAMVQYAYYGEQQMLRKFPSEFPSNPDTDHGFRLLKLYGAGTGSWRILGAMASSCLSLLCFGTALIRDFHSVKSPLGLIVSLSMAAQGAYWAWFYLR